MERKQTGLILIFVLIISVLAASGCTLPSETTTIGQGVVIENFEVDFPRIYAGEKFKLQMMIRNTGSVDAYNVYPKLYNIDTTMQNNRLEISCQETCRQGVSLLAPDPERGTTGESRTCIWDCVAPSNIPKGLPAAFNPSARLYYLYETHTIKSVNIVSQNELRSLQSQGKSLPSETISTTTGPVQLDVVVQGPIRYWEGENKIRFPININIQNMGGGVVCMDKQKITIPFGTGGVGTPLPIPPSTFIDVVVGGCENTNFWDKVLFDFYTEDSSVNLYCGSDTIKQNMVGLWRGQSATLTCEVEMPVPSGHAAGIIQKNLKFSVYYAYFTDRTVNIEVVGRETA